MDYSYKVRDSNNQVKTGVIDASSDIEAVSKLQNMGFLVINISTESNSAVQLSNNYEEIKNINKEEKRTKKLKIEEIILFFDQFSVLLGASVDIIKSLDILAMQSTSEPFYLSVLDIKKQVSEGLSLSKAMKKYPKIYSLFIVNLIEIGETGGVLENVTKRIAIYLEKSEDVKRQIKSALTYPIILGLLGIGAIAVFLIKIIPTFEEIFKGFDIKLPMLTIMIINLSHSVKAYLLWEIIGIVIIIFGIKTLLITPQYRYLIDKYILRFPLLGDLLFKTAIVNFSMSFSLLLSNGVPIINAIEMTKNSINNMFLQDIFRRIKERVKSGASMAKELEFSGAFPPLVVQMISVGEESGKIVDMLDRISQFYEKRVTIAVKTFASIFEPIMLIVMGFIIGILVVAMFLPVFKLTQLGSRGSL